MIGDVIGLVAIDRLLRTRSERELLVACSIGCIASYVPWLLAPTPLAATLLAAPVGVFAAPLYPLVAAQAYAARPGASGSVLAASHLFTPLGLALPWLLGEVADAWGTLAALALLVLQPLGLVLLVGATRSRPGTSRPDRR
jgi:fucose permease